MTSYKKWHIIVSLATVAAIFLPVCCHAMDSAHTLVAHQASASGQHDSHVSHHDDKHEQQDDHDQENCSCARHHMGQTSKLPELAPQKIVQSSFSSFALADELSASLLPGLFHLKPLLFEVENTGQIRPPLYLLNQVFLN